MEVRNNPTLRMNSMLLLDLENFIQSIKRGDIDTNSRLVRPSTF